MEIDMPSPVPQSADHPCTEDESNQSHVRRNVFRRLSVLSGLLLAFALGEVAARIHFHQNAPHLEMLREHLANEVPHAARIIGQPYLLYVPAPGYRSGRNMHNEQGYRGPAVQIPRTEGVVRVLCLGGSTTYGTGVEDPLDSYPAQLETILNYASPPEVKSVEVINGGVEYATTAELLTHYHFKYHYFKPDVVIINTGGNDGLPPEMPNYQPDYSHWREQPGLPRPLSPFGQQLMRSRLFGLGLIYLLYGGGDGHVRLDRVGGVSPTSWYQAESVNDSIDTNPAFAHNLNTLIDEVLRDGATAVLVPYRKADDYDVPEEIFVRQNEQVLKLIAEDRKLTMAPFPASVISSENWVDGSHVNEEGCQQKAAHIAEYLIPVLWPTNETLSRTIQ